MTLHELKQIIHVPDQEQKIPTAKKLKNSSVPIIREKLDADTEIAAYLSGYVVYSVRGNETVFPIASCKGYIYEAGKEIYHIPESIFEQECWYLRLLLEGEDRLCRNREAREQGKVISYSAFSEEWKVMAVEESLLEQLICRECVDELLSFLTNRQRSIILHFFVDEKTQQQIAEELGITVSAVSKTLYQAIRKMRKSYLYGNTPFKKMENGK